MNKLSLWRPGLPLTRHRLLWYLLWIGLSLVEFFFSLSCSAFTILPAVWTFILWPGQPAFFILWCMHEKILLFHPLFLPEPILPLCSFCLVCYAYENLIPTRLCILNNICNKRLQAICTLQKVNALLRKEIKANASLLFSALRSLYVQCATKKTKDSLKG